MKKKNMLLRSILSVVLAFFIAFLTTGASAATVIRLKVLSPDSLCAALQSSDFGKTEHTRVREVFVSYGLAANVDEEFFTTLFTDTFTEQVITDDMCKALTALFEENSETPDFSSTRTILYDGLFSYAEAHEMDITDEDILAGLNEFCDMLMEQYESFVTIPYASTVKSIITRISKLCMPAALICLTVSVAMAVLLFAFFRSRKRPASYLAASFGGAGLMLLVAPLIVYLGGIINKLTILDEALFSFFKTLVNGTLVSVMLSSIPFFVLFVILSAFSLVKNGKKNAS